MARAIKPVKAGLPGRNGRQRNVRGAGTEPRESRAAPIARSDRRSCSARGARAIVGPGIPAPTRGRDRSEIDVAPKSSADDRREGAILGRSLAASTSSPQTKRCSQRRKQIRGGARVNVMVAFEGAVAGCIRRQNAARRACREPDRWIAGIVNGRATSSSEMRAKGLPFDEVLKKHSGRLRQADRRSTRGDRCGAQITLLSRSASIRCSSTKPAIG